MHDHDAANSEIWRARLTGEDPAIKKLRRYWRWVPSSPRCKVCAAPFHGLGRLVTSVIQHGHSRVNPLLCGTCFGKLRQQPGGAEIEISVLFADVRGSTGIAERTSPTEFRRLLQRFYMIASQAIERNGGVVDKFLGDGVMALFIPVMTGERHAARAIEAGRAIVDEAERSELRDGDVRIGVGMHTGTAYVGVLGSGDNLDFSALGDAVNIAARLGSVAGPGELLVSRAAWDAASLPDAGNERREVEITGRDGLLDVVVARSDAAHAAR